MKLVRGFLICVFPIGIMAAVFRWLICFKISHFFTNFYTFTSPSLSLLSLWEKNKQNAGKVEEEAYAPAEAEASKDASPQQVDLP